MATSPRSSVIYATGAVTLEPTARAWRVLVEATRRRHLRFRRRLADQLGPDFYLSSPLDVNCSRDAARLVIDNATLEDRRIGRAASVVSAGV